MDRHWHDVAEFLRAQSAGAGETVAPIELDALFPVGIAYSNAREPQLPGVRALVLHKGRYQEIDKRFLVAALGRLTPVFANEVFIVLAEDGTSLDPANPHLAALPPIRAWSETPGDRLGEPRMAATYVGNGVVLAETINRHLVALHSADRGITPHIIRRGYFARHIQRFIERFLRPGMTFVDVGAHVGLFSLIAAAAVGGDGRVIAIEPVPRLRELLFDNLAMNGFRARTTILPYAAGDTESEAGIHEFRRFDGGSTLVREIADTWREQSGEEPTMLKVEVKPLTALLEAAGVERADLIKIDVEGFERQVLRGACGFLARQARCDIVLEWHASFMTVEEQASLHALLTSELGCSVGAIERDGSIRPISLEELGSMKHVDLLAHRG